MALFELKQDTGSGAAAPWAPPTFKDCVAADIDAAFFEENEHADRHTVDGKDVLIVLEDDDLREHSAHWEAGAKQNFDTGLYTAHTILYIRVEDYGPKPKIGKQLVLDKGTKSQRTFTINLCQEESGVYRMTMETKSGDTWDVIAKQVYGSEYHADILMAANPQQIDTFLFEAGVVLATPVLEEERDGLLPPWKYEASYE